MNINDLLSRLDKVRDRGKGQWTACCPAHDDKSPSLSVALGQDGRLLIHCFGGCDPSEVVGALGMSLSDLMPEHSDYGEPLKKTFSANAVLSALTRELTVVVMSGNELASGRALSPEDDERLRLAVNRITEAQVMAGV